MIWAAVAIHFGTALWPRTSFPRSSTAFRAQRAHQLSEMITICRLAGSERRRFARPCLLYPAISFFLSMPGIKVEQRVA